MTYRWDGLKYVAEDGTVVGRIIEHKPELYSVSCLTPDKRRIYQSNLPTKAAAVIAIEGYFGK